MRKFGLAALISALFTMFGGSFYYLFAVLDALANGKDVVAVFVNTVIGCLILWAFGTYVVYQINETIEEINQAQRQEYEERVRRQQLEDDARREKLPSGDSRDDSERN